MSRKQMWEAYGPYQGDEGLTFSNESYVGPTEHNDCAGPLAVVSGDTPDKSLENARRIANLLNESDSTGEYKTRAEYEQAHGLCVYCGGEGKWYAGEKRGYETCPTCKGSGKLSDSAPQEGGNE